LKPAPFPENEMGRIIALADFNLDYYNLSNTFKDLTKLAAKATGSPISMINLIDNYTVWTISSYGYEGQQTPREDSVCQYTILEKEGYVVEDLGQHPIFKHEEFVTGELQFRFYQGIPLADRENNLGALCVLDRKAKSLSAEKVELLRIIADEILNRLRTIKYIETLRNQVNDVQQKQKKVVHDIRGPIAGIIGLAEIIASQGKNNDLDEVLEFINLIHKGGGSILELADEILSEEKNKAKHADGLLHLLKQRFEQLYVPQALSKNVTLKVEILHDKEDIDIPQSKLMQVVGNLISNAIKFTPKSGSVIVVMEVDETDNENKLKITVKDTGAGISKEQIRLLLADNTESTDGTEGEKGFGFGLALVKHLVKGMHGTFNIDSEVGKGSYFIVTIPYGA